jgi:hypothetical protein
MSKPGGEITQQPSQQVSAGKQSSGPGSARPSQQPSPPQPDGTQPNGQRIEAIKQYYNQLCTNLRHIVNQLNAPETSPQRRHVLLQQQEQVQKSLQEFTEKVLKPLASAAAAANSVQGAAPNSNVPILPPRQPSLNTSFNGPTIPGNKAPSPPQPSPASTSIPTPSQPLPVPVTAAPIMFQNAPPAARQALLLVQKQAQLIQQQQIIFGQKLLSKNFDSSLNHAHRDDCQKKFTDVGEEAIDLVLVSGLPSDSQELGSKRKANAVHGRTIPELLSELSPSLMVTRELEEGLLRLADDFIDNVASFASQLALNRKDTKLTRKDLEVAIERLTGTIVPGSHRNTILSTSVKKLSRKAAGGPTNNPHLNRMAQIKKFFAQHPN